MLKTDDLHRGLRRGSRQRQHSFAGTCYLSHARPGLCVCLVKWLFGQLWYTEIAWQNRLNESSSIYFWLIRSSPPLDQSSVSASNSDSIPALPQYRLPLMLSTAADAAAICAWSAGCARVRMVFYG